MEKICSLCSEKIYSDCDVCDDCNSFTKFATLVEDQFTYGGKKYALNGSEQRESTDELFDKHGKNWLIGTIDKYTFRFANLARERDLLKIACYMYITWLKRGFHIMKNGINDPALDTNVKQKMENFRMFYDKVKNYHIEQKQKSINIVLAKLASNTGNLDYLAAVSETLGKFSRISWSEIDERDLFMIYDNSFLTWVDKYANIETHDTDTNNKTNDK